MPLRKEICPTLTVDWESPQVLRLELAAAATPLPPGRLNLVVIAAEERLTSLRTTPLTPGHAVALISADGQLHRDLTGQTEVHASRPVDLIRAVQLAGTLLSANEERNSRRILLVWDQAPPSRLEFDLLTVTLARQDVALDVVTTTAAVSAWRLLTSRAFGQVSVHPGSLTDILTDYLTSRNVHTLEGAEVSVRGLVGIGPLWGAGRTTLPPLLPGQTHLLRLRRSSQAMGPSIEVRFPSLGYRVWPLLPHDLATQVA